MNTNSAAQPDHEPEAEKAQRAVQSVEVGGRLLLAFIGSPGPMSLKDLAAAGGLSPSRAHPYVVSFCKIGLIQQDPGTGHYALGPSALQLGLTCLQQLDPVKAATPVIEELARSTGHAVALAVWGNFGPTVVRVIEAREPLHIALRAGTVMSVLGTATGRAFAAVIAPERLARAFGSPLGDTEERLSLAVHKHAAELSDIASDYRRHGLARAAGRPIPGVNAFSAAAFDKDGEPGIVVTMMGHQDRFPSAWGSPEASAVRLAAQEISRRLGWSSALFSPA